MIIIYRTSPFGYAKQKLFGEDNKRACLENFLYTWGFGETFGNTEDRLVVMVDNGPEMAAQIDKRLWMDDGARVFPYQVIQTKCGSSAASFKHALEFITSEAHEDSVPIYFLEDDYLHTKNARTVLLEGLERSHYVSGYDHPDKYLDAGRGGNPEVESGGEITRVFLTESSHWKLTNSTTMTFMATYGVLKEDIDIILPHVSGAYPTDFQMFLELRARGRTLATPIPGVSTHTETAWLSPIIPWREV